LAFIVFGTLSKISLSIKSCFTGSGAEIHHSDQKNTEISQTTT
jgi:hypothetical protein